MLIKQTRYLILFCVGYLFFIQILNAETIVQASYQRSVIASAYDAAGKKVPLFEDYASFNCPAIDQGILFNSVASEVNALTFAYAKNSKRKFGFLLSMNVVNIRSYTALDLSFLPLNEQAETLSELSSYGCQSINARESNSIGEVSIGFSKVFDIGSFELESALSFGKNFNKPQPMAERIGADQFIDVSLAPAIGRTLKLSFPFSYRFGFPSVGIDRTMSVKVSYQSDFSVDLAVVRRLIGLSSADSITAQVSFVYSDAVLLVGTSKTIAGINALAEDTVQVTIAKFL